MSTLNRPLVLLIMEHLEFVWESKGVSYELHVPRTP